MCYIYGDIYETEEKKLQYINYIQENVISGMKKLVDAAEGLDSELNKHANQILAVDSAFLSGKMAICRSFTA